MLRFNNAIVQVFKKINAVVDQQQLRVAIVVFYKINSIIVDAVH